MTREELEQQFTSMLVRTENHRAYHNLGYNYFTTDENCQLVGSEIAKKKCLDLQQGDPKEWITKIFTEGLDIPPELYKVNILWLKHLEEINWEQT